MKARKYECGACGEHVPLNAWVVSRWHVDTGDRCPQCGSTHHIKEGVATRISPLMLPMDSAGLRVSPWYDGKYSPVVRGIYECRFRTIEPVVVLLHWNSYFWNFNGVRLSEHPMAWRGRWE